MNPTAIERMQQRLARQRRIVGLLRTMAADSLDRSQDLCSRRLDLYDKVASAMKLAEQAAALAHARSLQSDLEREDEALQRLDAEYLVSLEKVRSGE